MLMGEGTAPSVEWDLNLGIGRSTLHVLLNPVYREEKVEVVLGVACMRS